MEHLHKYRTLLVALLTAGSAILLIACGSAKKAEPAGDETLISRTVRNMERISTDNGQKTMLFRSPLMEDHAFAKAAFQEHREGIEVVGYDTLGAPSSRVVADYALHWTERDLWELKGNVQVDGENGQRLYTQQLTWDRKIKKVYSNVDSKVEDGTDVFIGEGFDADDNLNRWTFRRLKGTVSVDVEPADSTAVSSPGASAPAISGSSDDPVSPAASTPAPAKPVTMEPRTHRSAGAGRGETAEPPAVRPAPLPRPAKQMSVSDRNVDNAETSQLPRPEMQWPAPRAGSGQSVQPVKVSEQASFAEKELTPSK